jgi:MFS family permease
MENRKWFKTYMFIWAGQFASMLTSYAVQFAIVIWLSLEYKSAEVLAYAGIAAMLPQALIGLIAGVYVDRLNRKYVMIFSDAFIALCALLLLVILQNENVNLIWIYILLGLRSVGNAFHAPALQAIAPLIVPQNELIKVAGINQVLHSVCSIGGPAIGTLAIAYLPISKVLYLDLIGALLAILSLVMVKIPNVVAKSKSSAHSIATEFSEGFQTVSKNKGLRYLFLYAMAITFVIMPAAIMFPLLTTGHFAGGKWEIGIVEVVWGGGMYEYVKSNIIDEIFLEYDGEGVAEITKRFLAMGVVVHVSINNILPGTPNAAVENISHYTVITTSINIMSFKQKVIKRLMDIGVSIIGIEVRSTICGWLISTIAWFPKRMRWQIKVTTPHWWATSIS